MSGRPVELQRNSKKRASCPSFSFLLFLILCICQQDTADGQNMTSTKIDVGVILNMGTWLGKISQSCLSMALSDFYSTHQHYSTRLVLHTRDSKTDIVGAASSAIDLLKNTGVQAIIGPQSSSQAEFVVNIGNKTQVPIISFTATSASLSFTQTPYFIRTALNDSTQTKAIAAIVKTFGWREVVPIYESTEYGKDMIPYLTDAIQDINARVPYRSVISPLATDDQISGELYKLMTMQTRVFVVHMTTHLASRLFVKAKQAGMMNKGYVWIITDGLTDLLGSMDSSIVDSMQGVLGVKPYVPSSKALDNFKSRWRRRFIHENPDIDVIELSVMGLWAYDSIWALAMAAEKVKSINPWFRKLNNGKNTTDLDAIGISQMGPELLKEILGTKINGLSGEFWLNYGQLQSSAFQIVNVIGKGEREIGFWSPAFGISDKMEVSDRRKYSTSRDDLRAIIWPGESTVVPKGWEAPTSERKLRIGVPVKDGFSEFVKVQTDILTNVTMVTGFCIDVFKAVMDSLPYAIPYEFIPFATDDGKSAGNYNDLVDQIYVQNYDGVVGDTTILSNRSLHVDFTLPFTESGVSMIVPTKDDARKNAWIFLKPLTKDLWLTTGAFFIFTGFVVWVLEHRINKDFRGSPSQQVGMIFWFSFSTLVFAHKERVVSNLSRFVLIIWVFVVLILTSSYTASLTSMLTVQQLKPTVTDIKDLIKNGDYVGYQRGSFVQGLMESKGFDPSKLRSYNTPEEYNEALLKGSKNGGIAAIVDEMAYLKLYLAQYCTKYIMVGPTYKTAGFGFAFPKGSPLVPDMSRAILTVTEGNKMLEIEQTWFGNLANCPGQGGSSVTSDSLTLDSFKGLFLVAGIASSAALLTFSFLFVFENKDILTSHGSFSQKLFSMAKQFDKEKGGCCGVTKKTDPSSNGTTTEGEEIIHAEQDAGPPLSPAISISHHGEMIFSHLEGFSPAEPSTPSGDPPDLIEITTARS